MLVNTQKFISKWSNSTYKTRKIAMNCLVLKKKIIQKIFHLNQQEMKIYLSVLKMKLTKKLEIFQASINEKSLLKRKAKKAKQMHIFKI